MIQRFEKQQLGYFLQWGDSRCSTNFLHDLGILNGFSLISRSYWSFSFLLYHRSFWTRQKLYGKIFERYGVNLRKKYIYQNPNFLKIYLRDWNNFLNKQEWQLRENVELLVWLITPSNNANTFDWDQKYEHRWMMWGNMSGGTKVSVCWENTHISLKRCMTSGEREMQKSKQLGK